MRILFMGTPEFAVPILQTLAAAKHEIVGVVTQPDRPKGRGHGLMFSPVKECALSLGLEVLQPQTVKDENFIETITALKADIFVVVAYGQILPTQILDMPPLGCINIHASLLPKYRGAAPMQRAILNGDKVTGVTIMYMEKGLDTGDMLLKRELPIGESHRFIDLHDSMAKLSCECILEALLQIEAGTITRTPQNHAEHTYAAMLTKEDGRVDWEASTATIINQVRGLDPWPGTFTLYDGQVLKIWECAASEEMASGTAIAETGLSNTKAGEVIESDKHLLVKTADGALSITILQGPGGKRMNAADYLRGRPIAVGTILGE